MIRQHFFPKNAIRKRCSKSKPSLEPAEHHPAPNKQKNHTAGNLIYLDPEITEPLKGDFGFNGQKRLQSVLKPMQSVVLQTKSKQKRKIDERQFLLESRRKKICSPLKRDVSMGSQVRSEIENVEVFELGLYRLHRTKESKKKERVPMSLRTKLSSPFQCRSFEMKVKGWQTNVDEFIDFL